MRLDIIPKILGSS